MRVFISWSGDESREVATVLRQWLKQILQTVEPWMSHKDIASGARWSHAISAQLRDAKVGIICLTPDNVSATWLHFEAGALSKTVDDSFVCPLLFRIEPSDLKGPMGQFQAQRFGHDGMLRVLETIRSHPDHNRTLNDTEFVDTFEALWPALEEKVSSIQKTIPATPPPRDEKEMIAETLELVRGLTRDMKSGAGGAPALSRLENLLDATSPHRQFKSTLSEKARTIPVTELVRMLIQWDSTLTNLLGSEQKVRSVVDAIVSNQIGQATSAVMAATGYKLPEARAFVDSLTHAISTLSE